MIARFVQAALVGGALGFALWLLVGDWLWRGPIFKSKHPPRQLDAGEAVDEFIERMRHGGA